MNKYKHRTKVLMRAKKMYRWVNIQPTDEYTININELKDSIRRDWDRGWIQYHDWRNYLCL